MSIHDCLVHCRATKKQTSRAGNWKHAKDWYSIFQLTVQLISAICARFSLVEFTKEKRKVIPFRNADLFEETIWFAVCCFVEMRDFRVGVCMCGLLQCEEHCSVYYLERSFVEIDRSRVIKIVFYLTFWRISSHKCDFNYEQLWVSNLRLRFWFQGSGCGGSVTWPQFSGGRASPGPWARWIEVTVSNTPFGGFKCEYFSSQRVPFLRVSSSLDFLRWTTSSPESLFLSLSLSRLLSNQNWPLIEFASFWCYAWHPASELTPAISK